MVRTNVTDREDFQHKVIFNPLDVSLGLNSSLDMNEMNQKILEVYLRFYYLGWLREHGDKCFFQSYLLRRILRLHGIEAHVRQVTMYYSHKDRGWTQTVGEPMNITHQGNVDSHAVVFAGELLLDFSLRDPIFYAFGARAPTALIGLSDSAFNDIEQDFGEMGQAIYTIRRPHKHTKHILYEERDGIIYFTKEYFKRYQM